MAHTITPEGGTTLAPAAGYTLAAEAGTNLAPAVHGGIEPEGGTNLAPAVHGVIRAEGGTTLAPAVHGVIQPEGGTNLAPAVHGVIQPEGGAAGLPDAPSALVPEGGFTGGGTTYATGSLAILGNAATGAVEILGTALGTFQATAMPGKTIAESYAIALADEINAMVSEGGLWPTATVIGATVRLTAGLPGVIGNYIGVASTAANVVPSGAFLTGGAGDVVVGVSGSLTRNGTAAVTFPPLPRDQMRASVMPEYASDAGFFDWDGTFGTGWRYTAQIGSVFTGTFPSLVFAGYRWTLRATRYQAGVWQEQAEWLSAMQPTAHPLENATGWAATAPATGVPVIAPPMGASISAPPALRPEGGGNLAPAAPAAIVPESSY